jgi:hypothetical protein
MPHPRHWPAPDDCGVVAQDQQLGDGRTDGLCSSATRLGRSAWRVTGRSRCWAAAARRRPIAWSLGRSVADDLGAQQPRHLGAVPDRPGGPRCPSRRHGQRLGGRGGRLAAHDRHGDLDRQAAQTIQHLLTGDSTDHAGPRLLGARTWAIPFRAYWLSGPDNHHLGLRRRRAGPFHTGPPHPPAMSGHATVAASPPGPVSSWAAGSHLPSAACFEPDGRHFSHGRRLRANNGCPRPWPRDLWQYRTGKNLGDR